MRSQSTRTDRHPILRWLKALIGVMAGLAAALGLAHSSVANAADPRAAVELARHSLETRVLAARAALQESAEQGADQTSNQPERPVAPSPKWSNWGNWNNWNNWPNWVNWGNWFNR